MRNYSTSVKFAIFGPDATLKLMKEVFFNPTDLFEAQHGVSVEEAFFLRAIVEENNLIVSNLINNNSTTTEQIQKIYNNKNYLLEFEDMAYQMLDCSVNEYTDLVQEVSRQPDIFCAWLIFYNQFLSDEFDLNLTEPLDGV